MTDESYDMRTIEGCIGWGLFRNPPERQRLEAELVRLRAVEAAARAAVDAFDWDGPTNDQNRMLREAVGRLEMLLSFPAPVAARP